jgi:UDP-N-acetyl-D-mannosaminuronic acid dehydrogenase
LKFKRICVLGLGYIGLPTASTFATQGLKVIGVDVNPRVVEILQNGGLHIHEPGLRTLVQAALSSGNLEISDQPQPADAFIIAVPTPFYEDKRADMRAVTAAAESIVPCLRAGNLVVLESTSPPRTTLELLVPILERSGLQAGVDFHLVYSPERVLPGQILREMIENARVIGGVSPACAAAGRELYAIFVRGEIVLTDATTAEMVKLMENTYRDVNIAIANEFARLADSLQVNVWEAIALANRHPRVNILKPGPGVGGHCISVDPWFLVEAAPDQTPLIQAARTVNSTQPDYVAGLVRSACGDLKGRRIAILGLSYKPNVDDLRESPAIEIAQSLAAAGAEVIAYEPNQPDLQVAGLECVATLEAALQGADLIALLVAHSDFLELAPASIAGLSKTRVVVDAVNGWSSPDWRQAGFQVFRLGDGSQRPVSGN